MPKYRKHNIHFTDSRNRGLHLSSFLHQRNSGSYSTATFPVQHPLQTDRKGEPSAICYLTQRRVSTTSCCRSVVVLLSGKVRQHRGSFLGRERYRADLTQSFFHTLNTLSLIMIFIYPLLVALSTTLLLSFGISPDRVSELKIYIYK